MHQCEDGFGDLTVFFCVGRVEWDVRIWVWKVIVMGALGKWFLGV